MVKVYKYIAGTLIMTMATLMIPQNVYASTTDNSQLLSELDKIADSGEEKETSIMIAHRGMSSLAPENTIPAIEMAGVYGYGGVEFDVQETKDGKYIISHDADVKRMTNGTGKISSMTLDQIKKLTIDKGNGIENYSGLKIATLEEVLTCCKEYNLIPCIEIKNIKNVKGLLKIVKKYDFMKSATIASKKVSILKSFRQINSNISLSLISSDDGITAINTAKMLKCNEVSLEYVRLNEKVVAYAKQKGMSITAWTVDSLAENYQCRKYGVDFITTNSMTDSNNFENLAVDKNYDIAQNQKDKNIESGKIIKADSIQNCIANKNTWFEENNVTTVNIGSDMSYNYEMIDDDIEKGNVITITAQVNSVSGNYPYFKVYENEKLDCNYEEVNKTTGWHTVKLVYTAKTAMHLNVLYGLNENEPGIFRIKNIQISKLSRYQPESITMTDAVLELSVGSIYNLPENMQSLSKKTIMKWKSSKAKTASVSELGCVTAKKVGKTIITVTTENGKTSTCMVIVKPKKMSELKVTNNTSKGVKLKWTKNSDATGYEIYSKEEGQEEFQLVESINNKSKTIATLTNNQQGKTYYYKIRAYIKIDGKQYYGEFSNAKSVSISSK